jgi:hypothetical protein
VAVKFSLTNPAAAADANAAAGDTGWMSSQQYQAAFEGRRKRGFYPARVEGRNNAGQNEFRADWQAMSAGCQFASNHGLTSQTFDQYSERYKSQGYALASTTQFVDAAGTRRLQVTWTRNCAN